MGITYGPRGEPLMSDGRPIWYLMDGTPATSLEADELLGDIAQRRIASTEITPDVYVSTIFTVIDERIRLGWPQAAEPILWETKIFGGPDNGHEFHWITREQALHGHDQVVAATRIIVGASA
jgi:hypothetical protein